MPNMMPAIKRTAVPDNKNGGMLPMYQPSAAVASNAAYQQATFQALQLQQQPAYAPVTSKWDSMGTHLFIFTLDS